MLCLQDDEYLASLQADREKELKAREEAEVRLIEEQAANCVHYISVLCN